MKIFTEEDGSYSEKVNFADKNNLLVGYDLAQSCCEHADWFISKTEDKETIEGHGVDVDLREYSFDPDYFVQVELEKSEYGSTCLDEGGMVRFKLVADNEPNLYLHLYNSHNGYYSHGFTMSKDKEVIHSGSL